jgi:hypothetical protein
MTANGTITADETNLFGEVIVKDPILRDRFIEPPFSVLDTKTGSWQKRKQAWITKGIASEVGRDATTFNSASKENTFAGKPVTMSNTSIFDPALCEVLYHWFCPDNGRILDPFAGGSVRGVVANYLDYNYTGIDIRQEQVDSNREQAADILPVNNQPQWYVGDSNEVLNAMAGEFDFVFSCPPYADLEVYSDLEGDISNMKYADFMPAYAEIIAKSCALLKKGAYACFVVGEVRDKKGNYIGFVPDTIKAFTDCGMSFYNEAILLNQIGTAMMRAGGNMKSQKLVKVHQNVLVFRKDL